MDKSGKDIVGDGGLNGVELGPAEEVTRGWKPADRLASYSGGSGTDTMSFVYIVQEVSVIFFRLLCFLTGRIEFGCAHTNIRCVLYGDSVGMAELSSSGGLGLGGHCRRLPSRTQRCCYCT